MSTDIYDYIDRDYVKYIYYWNKQVQIQAQA